MDKPILNPKNNEKILTEDFENDQIFYISARALIQEPIAVKTTNSKIQEAIAEFEINLDEDRQLFTYHTLYDRLKAKNMQEIYKNKTPDILDGTCDLNHQYDEEFEKICDDIFELAILRYLVFGKGIPVTLE